MVVMPVTMIMVIVPVVMPVPVIVIMLVIIMAMPVMVMPVLIHLPQAAFTSAERGAEIAILNIAAGCGNALAFDMVVMAFLRQADLILETKHLGAVFAH